MCHFGFRIYIIMLSYFLGAGLAHAELDAKQLKLVRAAPTGMRQAVATAERDLKGKAYSATSSFSGDVVLYSVKLLVADKPVVATIDAKTGKITGKTAVTGEAAALLRDFAKLKGTLLAAIRAAETTAKGKSFSASFKRIANKEMFDIDAAARDDAEKEVIIDAASGKIRKVTDKTADPAAPATAIGATSEPAQ
jgi:uncharacterized membrane protein YkoI